MNEKITLLMTCLAGLLLGVFFFGGLWVTVKKGMVSPVPVLWFVFSLFLRLAGVVAGFYFISQGQLPRMLFCAGGFLLGKYLIVSLTKNRKIAGEPNGFKQGGIS